MATIFRVILVLFFYRLYQRHVDDKFHWIIHLMIEISSLSENENPRTHAGILHSGCRNLPGTKLTRMSPGTFGEAWIFQWIGSPNIFFEWLNHIRFVVSQSHQTIWSRECTLEEPIDVEVPIYNDKGETTTMKLPLLRPTDILEYLFSTDLTIPERAVTEFWDHLESVGDPWAKECNGRADRLMPLGLYGDEAHYGAEFGSPLAKITAIFLDLPLWRPCSVRLSKFMVFGISSHRMIGRKTLHPIWCALVENLNVAYRGVAGRRFIVAQLRGDQVWHHDVWKHVNWWKANQVCYQCGAQSKRAPFYYEIGESASWKGTEIGTIEFLSRGVPPTDLWDQVKFENIVLDCVFVWCFLGSAQKHVLVL